MVRGKRFVWRPHSCYSKSLAILFHGSSSHQSSRQRFYEVSIGGELDRRGPMAPTTGVILVSRTHSIEMLRFTNSRRDPKRRVGLQTLSPLPTRLQFIPKHRLTARIRLARPANFSHAPLHCSKPVGHR